MNFSIKTIVKPSLLFSAVILTACSANQSNKTNQDSIQQFGAKYVGRTYQQTALMPVPSVDNRSAVVNQRDFVTQLSNIRQSSSRLVNKFASTYGKVTNWVLSGADTKELANYGIQAQIMKGNDGYQNVLMTGYYSPVIHARHKPQGKYNQPIYAMPANKRFSRAQIYAGALQGKGLELAYSDSMIDNFLLGVQGSGYVDFGNGDLSYFAYAGQNDFDYVAVGRLLVEDGEVAKEKMSMQAIKDWAKANPSRLQALLERNPSYVFFKKDPNGKVRGSAGVPLVPMASIASDKHVIPTGSVVLVEVPQIDDAGHWTGEHSLHLMVALDVGRAIKGQHLDLYLGIGDKAGHIAGLSKHYGRVWLLQ